MLNGEQREDTEHARMSEALMGELSPSLQGQADLVKVYEAVYVSLT